MQHGEEARAARQGERGLTLSGKMASKIITQTFMHEGITKCYHCYTILIEAHLFITLSSRRARLIIINVQVIGLENGDHMPVYERAVGGDNNFLFRCVRASKETCEIIKSYV